MRAAQRLDRVAGHVLSRAADARPQPAPYPLAPTPAAGAPTPPPKPAGAVRIGLIADTHVPETMAELYPQAYAAFAGCDAIYHAGDIYDTSVLEQLAAIAPT